MVVVVEFLLLEGRGFKHKTSQTAVRTLIAVYHLMVETDHPIRAADCFRFYALWALKPSTVITRRDRYNVVDPSLVDGLNSKPGYYESHDPVCESSWPMNLGRTDHEGILSRLARREPKFHPATQNNGDTPHLQKKTDSSSRICGMTCRMAYRWKRAHRLAAGGEPLLPQENLPMPAGRAHRVEQRAVDSILAEWVACVS